MLKFAGLEAIMRVVFMGSPTAAVPSLERLVMEGYDVAAVCTQPDRPAGRGKASMATPVKEAARRLGVPVVQPESLRSAEAIARLAELRPEIIIVCAYGQILPQAVLGMPPRRCVNVHFSLLPRHRGASPVAAAILAGDEFTGVTIMLVEKRLDTGPLLAAGAVPIQPWDNTGTLTGKLSLVGAGLLIEALSGWQRGEITPRPQDEAAATYFREVSKDAGKIDWGRPAVEIWRLVRAYQPWPGGYTTWRGRQLKIIEAAVLAAEAGPGEGRVIELAGGRAAFGIGTGQGVLGLLRVQLEGRKAMSGEEFLRGQRDFIGSVLPS
jgi:methionyl-tRNA formyltransferase